MGLFGSIGKALGKVAGVAGMIPGVGTLAGGALGAAGGLLSGGGLKGALGGAAKGAAGPLAGKLLGSAGALGGLGGGFGKKFGSSLLKNAPTILGGLGAVQGAKQISDGNKRIGQASDIKMGDYNALKPVRDKAIATALLGRPKAPNLAHIYKDPTNPFARNQGPPPEPMVPPGMPPGPTPMPSQGPPMGGPAPMPGLDPRALLQQGPPSGLVQQLMRKGVR